MASSNRSKNYNVTVRGISLAIPKDVLDDIDTIDLLGEVQDGNVFAFPKLSKRLFGEKGYEKVKGGLAGKDGRTKVSDMVEFFTEVFSACNALSAKN